MPDPSLPAGSPVWGARAAPGAFGAGAGVRHAYPLAVRDHGLATAFGLLLRSLPYALARLGLLLAYTIGCIVWLVVAIGGGAWLGAHIAEAFGGIWIILCLVGIGWFWATVLRYTLHLVACGHVAVLTELITHGKVGNGTESMFDYGRRIVTARFGEVTALFGLNALVRGVVRSFHRTLDWIDGLLPIPGLDALASLLTLVLRAATRYLDKVIFSYGLARDDADPWTAAREGVVYYAQNAKPILTTSVWIVVLEKVLTVVLWLLLLAPAAAITLLLPHAVRETGGLITVVIAVLLAGCLRSAFIKPLFLIMMMVRFHALIEHQPIDAAWNERLAGVSTRFAEFAGGGARV
jgi:hypothetical protein